ncbi:IroE protein [Hypoxylon crocopeplum]|nr:IroE protein [Hypoxylon crocopeplum]
MLNWAASLNIGSAEEWSLKNKSGQEYIVQIGFPRVWVHYTPAPGDTGVPVIYLTDGNSVFLTALEALYRRLSIQRSAFPAGVIVAIGYPISPDSSSVFSPRRVWDLTPPAPECKDIEGGADDLIEFISDRVKPFVRQRLADTRGVSVGKEVLYGHSLGGLFCLHTMFTRPGMFDCFIASSPSLWWNGEYILKEEAEFRNSHTKTGNRRGPSLMLFVGGQEQNPPQRRGEADDEYEERLERHKERRMVYNVRDMYCRLDASAILQNVSSHVYEGEDHGTVISCSLSRGLTTFFEDWPFQA